MVRVAIIGCGIVGTLIAFELSQFPELQVTAFDKQPPAQGATGAALGVLMGVISHKTKGRNWQLRETSLQRYETLIPELEAVTGRKIPFNKQGILMLCAEGDDLSKWEKLIAIRQSQGWKLELWDVERVREFCPHLYLNDKIVAAIYSPQDRQVDPTALTLALVDAAERNGAIFEFGVEVEGLMGGQDAHPTTNSLSCGVGILPVAENFDWFILAAGLGSSALTASLNQLVDIRPVLGQALHLRLKHPLENPDFRPVITCDDVHIVPVGDGEYWVGATVEFPENGGEIPANADLLEEVMARARSLCPALAEAEIIKQWSGLRPRPEGRPAPIIETLPGNSRVLIASGHYRNGILLAPATARSIREMILQ
ncbi:FAD-binding oxidoreductase [Tychonema sp. LEGE 07203]|uniref:NAD(P)/FAD-dependent oxidoreductase n=1 Tax=Tychonema sp. LEGE 07203 TaxID=1828671 RepID=UPI00187F0492|nr:FAD-dependent oxidoreductase [Tychonema sp. LEGE 07203]MBE9093488.1 FAD-binding oxidoreductase [Tychonema sp. LEGE 07203]